MNPIFIAHRINTIEELREIPSEYGIEIDIRDELLVVHDPFNPGIYLEDLLKEYHHRFIILNIKCERIEYRILELMKKYGITEYFFLDCSFPMIYKLTSGGENRVAIRYSEYEHSILEVKGRCQWIWVDSFNDVLSLSEAEYKSFREAGFKFCFVSPELHGYDLETLRQYVQTIKERGMTPDMICTKIYNIDTWKGLLF